MSVYQNYQKELKARGFKSDPAQLRAIDALERCATEWSSLQREALELDQKNYQSPRYSAGVFIYTVVLVAAKVF